MGFNSIMKFFTYFAIFNLCGLVCAAQTLDTLFINKLNTSAYNLYMIETDSAIHLSQQALELATKANYSHGQGLSYLTLTKAYWAKGNFMLSMKYGFETLKIFENTSHDYEKSHSYLAVGRTLVELGNQVKAKEFILHAIRHAQELPDSILLAEGYREYSYLLAEQKLYDSALYYCDLAIPIFKGHSNNLDVSVLYGRKARVFFDLKNFEKSREFAYKGIPIDSLEGNERALAIAKFFAARSELQFKNRAKAFQLTTQSINIFNRMNNHQWLTRCHDLLATLYKENGNLEKAIEELQLVSLHRDQLSSSEKSGQIEEMQALYELGTKENTIRLLENENKLKQQQVRNQRLFAAVLSIAILLLIVFIFFMFRLRAIQHRANRELTTQKREIQSQAENLERLNKLKTKLFSVISHDLRGPITNIKVLFGMITNKTMTQEEFLALSVKLKSTVDNTHRTLENLLNWCLSQMDGIKTEAKPIELSQAIDEACKLLEDMSNTKKITLQKEIEKNAAVLADPNQLQLILRNLIHNAIKFSKPEAIVQITATQSGDYWKITLRDSGVGMTDQEITTILDTQDYFSKYGTGQEKGTGLGLMLCKEFISRNKGKLEIESSQNQGTAISIYLPKAT